MTREWTFAGVFPNMPRQMLAPRKYHAALAISSTLERLCRCRTIPLRAYGTYKPPSGARTHLPLHRIIAPRRLPRIAMAVAIRPAVMGFMARAAAVVAHRRIGGPAVLVVAVETVWLLLLLAIVLVVLLKEDSSSPSAAVVHVHLASRVGKIP